MRTGLRPGVGVSRTGVLVGALDDVVDESAIGLGERQHPRQGLVLDDHLPQIHLHHPEGKLGASAAGRAAVVRKGMVYAHGP